MPDPPRRRRLTRVPGHAYDFRTVESRWQHRWEARHCFRAPPDPVEPRFFNYDSGPFPNGELHLGHLRTYVLGDMTARYQRLLGKSVLYCTEWDAFGLPNELAALERGISPRRFTASCVRRIAGQLKRLGISYDWERIPDTSSPVYYRWTQWLFLRLWESGLVDRMETELAWCPDCRTTLARMQVVDGACWRCETPVATKRMPQWSVRLSRFSRRLLRSLDELDGWSPRARNLLRGFISGGPADAERVHDWVVSRQRSWGTPIPVVHCGCCGAVPVRDSDLPVVLPDDLDWSLGSGALAACENFVHARCPACSRPARRETDTLDCYFDDIWCFLAAGGPLGAGFSFSPDVFRWMPVDRFHSGYDTLFYLHLHRFLGAVLADRGLLTEPEPIRSYLGHDMVLSAGRKMSTHLGNAVFLGKLLNEHGADALRVAILWSANPARPVHFEDRILSRSADFLSDVHALYSIFHAESERPPPHSQRPSVSRSARGLKAETDSACVRIGRLIDDYRPRTALDVFDAALQKTRSFAQKRIESRRLSPPDRTHLGRVLQDLAVALSPLAPHLAEESWRLAGNPPFVSLAHWPTE